ncbi:MAG: Ig-like domain-containing protein, partial [Treponema sp.]|nr:Ig-like domain-containing protein [Treponema sp.]
MSDGEKTFKVGYDTEVQFTLNQDSYVFEKLEAVVRNSPETSRSESVQFTEVESDAKKGIYKINVKVLKQVNDIMIRPVCTLLPKISSISPALEANGCNQDSAITIAFNKNMNPASFKDTNGTITGLSITNGDDEDLSAYFDEPYFASDNKTLVILPLCLTDNTKFLLPPDESKSSLNIKVNYTFVDVKDEDGLSFTENGTHNYKIN